MEINGLPLHPLAVHAAVVLVPIAALVAIASVVRPAWREKLRMPLLVMGVVTAASILVAYFSGDSFLESNSFFAGNEQIEEHEEYADKLLWTGLAFSVVAVAASFLTKKTGAVRIVIDVVLVLLAIAVLVLVFLTGEAGARAVWGNGFKG